MGDTAEPCHYRNNKTQINKIMIQTISLSSQTHGQLPSFLFMGKQNNKFSQHNFLLRNEEFITISGCMILLLASSLCSCQWLRKMAGSPVANPILDQAMYCPYLWCAQIAIKCFSFIILCSYCYLWWAKKCFITTVNWRNFHRNTSPITIQGQ